MKNKTMQTLAQLQSGALKGSVSLKLSEGLSQFPSEIFELADTLETLDLSGNQLNELPADFSRLKKLRILFCSDNLFTVLPEVLADCPILDIVGFKANRIETVPARSLNRNLRWLILTDNSIKQLPREIGLCPRMQKLMLAGNKLTAIPEELSNCGQLSLLRISANQMTHLPEFLLLMPKLSWLAFSGNLFSLRPETVALPSIPWSDLHISELLGEGASGIISKAAMHTSGGGIKDVAVKLFKGHVTSDGLPEDEMNAFIAAGDHYGLAQLIGQVAEHPDGKKGLVMELIPKRFHTLGLPPSLVSCTRDVFASDAQLSISRVLMIAGTIASVAEQLHSKGIMHGDLYAHNTLIDNEGHALLSDFGAASFYDKTNTKVAFAIERLEVSAFGYLLDDLLSLVTGHEHHQSMKKIGVLRDLCIAPNMLNRPSFADLSRELANIQTSAFSEEPVK